MPNPVRLLPISLVVLSPGLALADPLSFTGSLTATSNYIDDGISKTNDGPALQPYLEIGKNGFYGGLWASNIESDESDASTEVDLTGGYRSSITPGFAYDISYTEKFYNNGVDSTGEADLLFEGTPIDRLTLSSEGTYDTDASVFGLKLGTEYAITDPFSVSAEYGFSEGNSDQFWDVGATYALNDKLDLNVTYGDTPDTDSVVAVSMTYNFDFLNP